MAKQKLILRVSSSILLVFLVLLALNYLYLYLEESAYRYHWFGIGQATTTARPFNSSDSEDYPGECYPDTTGDEKQWRVRFGDLPGASVRGWPSKGGFYTLGPCYTVEMDFLGLDRFAEAERPQNLSSADEDAHCRRMRQLGAKWWASSEERSLWWFLHRGDGLDPVEPVVYFGWPSQGGVWALNMTLMDASEMGAGRIHMAITMEERCRIMEDLGAVYYTNPEACPLLDLSDEAVPTA